MERNVVLSRWLGKSKGVGRGPGIRGVSWMGIDITLLNFYHSSFKNGRFLFHVNGAFTAHHLPPYLRSNHLYTRRLQGRKAKNPREIL